MPSLRSGIGASCDNSAVPRRPGKRLPNVGGGCQTPAVTEQPLQLLCPPPDPRAHYFAAQYGDTADWVADLVVPPAAPEKARDVLATARDMLRHSYFVYEFSTAAVLHSLIAIEIAVRTAAGTPEKTGLGGALKQAAKKGLLTDRQVEYLDKGRELRNLLAHGKLTAAALTPRMAHDSLLTSFTIVGELFPNPEPPSPSP